MKQKIILLSIGLFCNLFFSIHAQSNSPSNFFKEGKELFQQGVYASAQQNLKEFLHSSPSKSPFREEAEYMLACTAYELKEPGRIDLLRNYLDKYPDSPYRNRVYSLLASAYFFEKKYNEAIALFNSCQLTLLSDKERDASALRLASAYLEVGKLQDAAILFRTLKESSDIYRQDAIYNLSYIDYLEKRYDNALSGFLSLQDNKTYAETVPFYIAEIYLLKKNYDKSEIVAQNFISSYPQSKETGRMERILGESEYGLEQYAKAAGSLEKYVNSANNPERSVLYQLGMSYFHIRAFTRAAETLEKVTTVEDALTQNAYLHIGLAYLQLKDKNRARMAFSQAASSGFDRKLKEQALYNYALCIHETAYSPFDESVKVFERFLNEFPNSQYSEKVSDYLVEVYMNTRSYEAALKSIAKISHPTSRILEAKQKILFQLGTQAFANMQFEKAIDYFNQSLGLSRYNQQTKADAYYWLGETSFRLKQYDNASRNFHLYLEYVPDKDSKMYALALYNLGYTAFNQKNYNAALNWFTKFTQYPKTGDRKIMADAYNRIGDCYFHIRNFADARNNYTKAIETDSSQGDYSLYQAAFVSGLQKNYSGKVDLLNRLVNQYPQSQYIDDAFYEKGRAYVQLEDNAKAIDAFRRLLTDFPESPIARKGANEIGLLYYQNDDYSNAMDAYKKVIISYPGSEEALLAQRDLKSIFIDLNKVEEYVDFMSAIPGNNGFNANERDSLTYIAAEKTYMRGDTENAIRSFEKYLQAFPNGAFGLNAHYYIGLTDFNKHKHSEALSHFEKVMEFPDNKFSEDAMSMSATILSDAKEYAKALAVYKQLKEKASTNEKRQSAKTGIMRSAHLSGNDKETILATTDFLKNVKLSPEQENEARYFRAKAYLNQQEQQQAIPDLQSLSKDTRNPYGAEAKYLLAQLFFNMGETALAEKEILDYIDKSTPHAYWLARSFILLSDIYVKTGKKADAKQYLLSLQENYQGNDDIAKMIEDRLKKLSK